ncbi:SDR family oxidoreductase [Paenirhodobacter enshiensis]|uniref:SDR family oxidoreductase n=1 Tax=Paenirhodobacter enshiensis TaxID=1105367 RepID=UPI003FA34145
MDLGIAGKRAIVCAGSRGLGRGCAEALAGAGVDIVLNARGAEALGQTAHEIAAATGVSVIPVAADITTAEGRARVLEAAGSVDILVNNAGGPPPGLWSDWSRDDFISALDANMLAPIAMMQAVLPGMIERGWGRVVNITSAAVRSPIAQLGLSNTARTGLTGFVAGTSRQVAGQGVVINNLLPGLHATDRAVSLDTAAAKAQGITVEAAAARRAAGIPVGRYGTTEEFGATCAFLCSRYAGFIVGQNIMLDGGAANISI